MQDVNGDRAGSALEKIEIQLERADVLELRLNEEHSARPRAQMQLLQMQAQQVSNDLQAAEKQKKTLLTRLEAKYEQDISRFAVDLETNIASGMAATSPPLA